MSTPHPTNPAPPRGEPAAPTPHSGNGPAIGAPASKPASAAPLNSQDQLLSTQQPSVSSVASCANLTPHQERIARIRQAKLNRFNALVAAGYSRCAAVSEIGWSYTTLWKIEKRIREQGLAGLIPKKSTGSRPLLDPALYTPAVIAELQRLAVKLGGSRAAARVFAGSPQCPRALARYILARDSVPTRLRQMIGFRRTSRTVRVAGNFTYIEGAGLDQQAAA